MHMHKFRSIKVTSDHWLYKEFAEILSDPVADILNTSFKEQKVPTGLKLANITPLPKVKQVHHPQKELRQISLTPALSKIAEHYVVTDYIKPAKSVDQLRGQLMQSSSL